MVVVWDCTALTKTIAPNFVPSDKCQREARVNGFLLTLIRGDAGVSKGSNGIDYYIGHKHIVEVAKIDVESLDLTNFFFLMYQLFKYG